MKTIGIIRHFDDLGRVVIPKEIRKNLNISENDRAEIIQRGREIIISKAIIDVCGCGQVLEDNSNYCPNCGKNLKYFF